MSHFKIMTYNILFGMRGDSFAAAFLSNLAMHALRPVAKFIPKVEILRVALVKRLSVHLNNVIGLIEKENPDLICLNEVLKGLHQHQLEVFLESKGYKFFVWGESGHHPYPCNVSTFLASKYDSRPVRIDLPLVHRSGGGGGSCALYIPHFNVVAVGAHLSMWRSNRRIQLKYIKDFVQKEINKKHRIILAGDLNENSELIKSFLIRPISGISTELTTFPSFSWFGFPKGKVLDYIIASGDFSLLSDYVRKGKSDHLAVISKINFIN